MRKILIAGNWKMNLDAKSAVELANAVVAGSDRIENADLLICPPHVYLADVARATAGSSIAVGAQNMYHESNGAFTGETSASMLLDVGAAYVILGHSERRNLIGESNEDVNAKVHAALSAGVAPIVCVGELLHQREDGETKSVIESQIEGSLDNVTADQMSRVIIAYEPVWAIGTGKVATPDQAEEVHADLRKMLAERYNTDVADNVRILYGGSMKPSNAAELIECPNVDGGLIGGASLNADDFLGIARAAG